MRQLFLDISNKKHQTVTPERIGKVEVSTTVYPIFILRGSF